MLNEQVQSQPRARAKVLLYCPVRLHAEQIQDMVATHRGLTSVHTIVYYNDCDLDASVDLKQRVGQTAQFVNLEALADSTYRDHAWTVDTVGRLAQIRNLGILHFNRLNTQMEDEDKYTHLFMVDADLILHPETVTALLSAEGDIVSEIFWSHWPGMGPWMPNCWDYNEFAFHGAVSVKRLAVPGVYDVGGLGACTLMRRDVIESGFVNYLPIYNRKHFGEDRDFCIRAAVAGHRLLVDTHYPPFHVYQPEQLAEARDWRDTYACDPAYFRTRWLTPEWESQVDAIEEVPETETKTVQALASIGKVIAVCIPGENFGLSWTANWTNLFGHLCNLGRCMPFFGYSSNVFITRGCMWDNLMGLVGTGITPDYILWIDDDNLIIPQDIDLMLSSLASHPEIDMLVGWCWIEPDDRNFADPKTSCGTLDSKMRSIHMSREEMDAAPDNLIEIQYSGFPVVLMRGSMLQKMKDYKFPFRSILSDDFAYGMSGEDVAFCVAAAACGCRIFVDRRLKVPHLKRQPAEPRQLRGTQTRQPLAIPSLNPVPEALRGLVTGDEVDVQDVQDVQDVNSPVLVAG